MEIVKLTATPRAEAGKGPARRIRREGSIPAVAYGQKKDPVALAVSPKALKAVLNSTHGQNSVLELSVEGGERFNVMVRHFTVHPISRELMHADFFRVDLDSTVDIPVPFKMVGKAKGVVLGGILQQIYRTLPVRCRPTQIPLGIEADVSDLDLNGSIKVSELTLPEGVSIRLPPEQTVAVVNAPEKIVEEEKAAPGAPAAAGKAAAAAPAAKAAGKDDKKKK